MKRFGGIGQLLADDAQPFLGLHCPETVNSFFIFFAFFLLAAFYIFPPVFCCHRHSYDFLTMRGHWCWFVLLCIGIHVSTDMLVGLYNPKYDAMRTVGNVSVAG